MPARLHGGQHPGERQLQLGEQPAGAALLEHRLERVGEVLDRGGLQQVDLRGLGGDVLLRRAEPVEGELRLLGGGVLELAAQVADREVAEVERALPGHRQVGGQRGVAGLPRQLPAARPDRQQRALDLVHGLRGGRVGEPGGQRLLVGDVQRRAEVDEGGVPVGGGQRDAVELAGAAAPGAAEDQAGAPGAGVRVQPGAQAAGRRRCRWRRRSRPRPRARRWSAWRTAGRAAPGTAGCRRACAPRCGPTAGRRGRPGRGRSGTARSSSVSRRFCITEDRCSRSFSPTLPLTVSTWSTSASSEPYSRIHLAAVFSPTLGMLGQVVARVAAQRREVGVLRRASGRTWSRTSSGVNRVRSETPLRG